MGDCLYFLPGIEADVGKAFAESGLADRLAKDGFARAGWEEGPDGQSGLAISLTGNGLIYKPAAQTWRGPFNDKKLWVGIYTDDPPGPDDLQRPQQIDGTPVELLDGREWLIPAWRLAPMALTMGMDGQVVHEPLPLRLRLEKHVNRIVEISQGKMEVGVEWSEIVAVAADVLSVNHRISRDPAQELSLLRLISTENVKALFSAVLDLEFWNTMAEETTEKKTGEPADRDVQGVD